MVRGSLVGGIVQGAGAQPGPAAGGAGGRSPPRRRSRRAAPVGLRIAETGGGPQAARFGDAEHRRACGPTAPQAAAWGYYSRKASEVASRMRFHAKVTAWERPGQRRVKRAIRGVAAPLHR